MKKTSILYSFAAIALCAFTFGCQSEKTSESVIDLEAAAREPKPFTQSDLPGTVSFIPLETTDSSLIGMDYTEGGFLRMILKDRRMERGSFIGKATGTMYPMDQIPPDKMRLPAFVWFDYVRPLDKEDIFNWRGKRADQVLQKSDRRPAASPRDMHIERTKK